jgi:hypothetical protein
MIAAVKAKTKAGNQDDATGFIVDQGVGDVSTLAATLINSKYWYFWWD